MPTEPFGRAPALSDFLLFYILLDSDGSSHAGTTTDALTLSTRTESVLNIRRLILAQNQPVLSSLVASQVTLFADSDSFMAGKQLRLSEQVQFNETSEDSPLIAVVFFAPAVKANSKELLSPSNSAISPFTTPRQRSPLKTTKSKVLFPAPAEEKILSSRLIDAPTFIPYSESSSIATLQLVPSLLPSESISNDKQLDGLQTKESLQSLQIDAPTFIPYVESSSIAIINPATNQPVTSFLPSASSLPPEPIRGNKNLAGVETKESLSSRQIDAPTFVPYDSSSPVTSSPAPPTFFLPETISTGPRQPVRISAPPQKLAKSALPQDRSVERWSLSTTAADPRPAATVFIKQPNQSISNANRASNMPLTNPTTLNTPSVTPPSPLIVALDAIGVPISKPLPQEFLKEMEAAFGPNCVCFHDAGGGIFLALKNCLGVDAVTQKKIDLICKKYPEINYKNTLPFDSILKFAESRRDAVGLEKAILSPEKRPLQKAYQPPLIRAASQGDLKTSPSSLALKTAKSQAFVTQGVHDKLAAALPRRFNKLQQILTHAGDTRESLNKQSVQPSAPISKPPSSTNVLSKFMPLLHALRLGGGLPARASDLNSIMPESVWRGPYFATLKEYLNEAERAGVVTLDNQEGYLRVALVVSSEMDPLQQQQQQQRENSVKMMSLSNIKSVTKMSVTNTNENLERSVLVSPNADASVKPQPGKRNSENIAAPTTPEISSDSFQRPLNASSPPSSPNSPLFSSTLDPIEFFSSLTEQKGNQLQATTRADTVPTISKEKNDKIDAEGAAIVKSAIASFLQDEPWTAVATTATRDSKQEKAISE
ncbi:hypothetical protein BDR26DRAFT_854690 [Obelidium mucronatum]|nr:hypothetical protein BDR26DRAFT_854690 [Obelidium mucronatum]